MGALREPWIFLFSVALLVWRVRSGGRPWPVFAIGASLGSLGTVLTASLAFRNDGDGLDALLPLGFWALLLGLTAVLVWLQWTGGLDALGPWVRGRRGLMLHGFALGAGLEIGREAVQLFLG